jgi:transitional endoplasmic reticulum ATPase
MVDPLLMWLAVTVTAATLVIETLARRPRSVTSPPEPARSPPADRAMPSTVDRHTPTWMLRYAQVFGPEQLSTFTDVVGMDALKRQLDDLVGPVLERHDTDDPNWSPAILLWGRRGSGKAVLIRAMAGQYGGRLVHVPARFLVPRDGGTSQPQLAMLLRYAQTNTPSVLFIDELEMLIADDAGGHGQAALHDVLNELRRRDRTAQSVVVASLTTMDALIPSVALTDVFDPVIHVESPDAQTRVALLQRLLERHRMVAEDPEAIVAMTAGRTRADLIRLLHEACAYALITDGPTVAVAVRHLRAVARPAPRLLAELALSGELRLDVERLAMALLDPHARVGAVLAGDRGTGKTTIGRALAASTRRRLVMVTAREARADAFEAKVQRAIARRPSLLLIDEHPLMESPVLRAVQNGCVPGPHGGRIAAAIDRALAQPGVAVIAIVRRFDGVDSQLRQRGRLDQQIWVSYPDRGARLELVRRHLRAVRLRDVSPATLADQLRGLTPAQIRTVLTDAVRSAERRMLPTDVAASSDDPVVTPTDLWRALQLVAA